MSLNNLSSFHFNRILQNATAFPAHIYQTTRNSLGVNAFAERFIKHPVSKEKKQTDQAPIPIKRIPAKETYQSSPFPERREPLIIEGNVTLKQDSNKVTPPVKNDPVLPAPMANNKPAYPRVNVTRVLTERIMAEEAKILEQLSTLGQRQLPATHSTPVPETPNQDQTETTKVTWKSGHGVVERVDKLTGEIVHLAEDFNKPLLVA